MASGMSLSKNVIRLNSGYDMPVLGLGTWQSKPGEVAAAVGHAIAAGYRHIDCAALYGNEREVGTAIAAAIGKSAGTAPLKRSDLFVTSKLWNTCHRPEYLEAAFRRTLADLGLDYLDLYLVHWPQAYAAGDDPFPVNEDGSRKIDAGCHPTDTYLQLEKLVAKGLVRSIGLSNYNSNQIRDVCDKAKIKPAVLQIEVHPYLGQERLIAFCRERGIAVTAYGSLASPGRPWAKPGDPSLLDDSRIVKCAEAHGKTPAQIVLRWAIQRGIIVIPKSVTPSRIEENAALFDFELTEEEMALVNSFECNGRLFQLGDANHPHNPFLAEF